MWTIALLVSITVTILLSISLINWSYNRSRVAKIERNKVRLELHLLFIFGLLLSKGTFFNVLMGYFQFNNKNNNVINLINVC